MKPTAANDRGMSRVSGRRDSYAVRQAAIQESKYSRVISEAHMDLKAEGDALMKLSRQWSAKVATAPVDDWIDFWAEDAVMMPPGLPPLRGKAAIRQYVETAAKLPGFQIRWEPESVCVSQSGELAFMIERNVTTVNDPQGNPVTAYGKVVTVWRKGADGSWRNIVDMWNEAPPRVETQE